MFELYFPDQKLEYLPAIVSLIVCIWAAVFTVRFLKKISKKEQQRAKELEKRMEDPDEQTPANKNDSGGHGH